MPNWKRIVVSGSDATLNTLTVSNGITGSLFGTASFATQALSASYAPSAVGATFPFTGSAIISGSLTVTGSLNNNGRINVGGVYAYSPTSSGITIVAPNESTDYKGTLEIFSNTTGADNGGSILLGGMQTGPIMYGLAKIVSGYVGSGYGGYLSFWTELASSVTTEKMRINKDGLVGIGTTTPTAVLHLKAGTATANTAPIKLTAGTNLTTPEAGVVEFNGNNLFFTTGSTRQIAVAATSALTSSRIPFATTNGRLTDSSKLTYGSTADTLHVEGSSGNTLFELTRAGEITYKYNINSSNVLNITNSTSDSEYYFARGNKFGIGVSATARLHVVGGTATANTAPIKLTAGTNLTTPEAGTIEFNGNNLFFTTGSTRSTILTNTNPASITGSLNISGSISSSLDININGITIGKGKNSLENQYFTPTATSITTGIRNVGIGSSAGTGVTSGNYLVAIGYAAGVSVTNGTHNVSVGGFAGYQSNGSYNTFVGMEANYRGAGNYNVAVGFDTMFENLGTRNTGIGANAGISIATGNDNTLLGYEAGRYISGGVTGLANASASLFLGAGARALASSQTNQIVIGYQATGLGSNTVVIGNNSIVTTSLKGNTQISGSLNVSGSAIATSFTGSLQGNVTGNHIGNTQITGSLLLSGSSLVAGYNPIPLAGTIQDGVTSVLGSLNDWASGFYQGTVLYSETAAGTIGFGQLCYRTNAETWALADATTANAAAAYNMLGICVKASTATNPTSILINGFVIGGYATVTNSGEPLYMSTTAGSVTNTAPTTVGNAVRIIGHTFWDSNTNTRTVIRFNPENSWIEL